jgi:hypothetical protein
MQPRQILLVAGVAIVAFAAAFGIAGAGGGDEPKAASAAVEPAKVIEVGDANVSAAVNSGGLPALQVPKKKPKQEESSSTTTTTSVAPTTTAPTTTAPTTTAPSTSTTPPPTNTNPGPTDGGGGGGPISTGGGED